MAPTATNSEGMGGLEEIKAPVGVVLPPKEIKGLPLKTNNENIN